MVSYNWSTSLLNISLFLLLTLSLSNDIRVTFCFQSSQQVFEDMMISLQTLFPNNDCDMEDKLELPSNSGVFKFWIGIPQVQDL